MPQLVVAGEPYEVPHHVVVGVTKKPLDAVAHELHQTRRSKADYGQSNRPGLERCQAEGLEPCWSHIHVRSRQPREHFRRFETAGDAHVGTQPRTIDDLLELRTSGPVADDHELNSSFSGVLERS